MTVEREYSRIASVLTARSGIQSGQMFGKACLKVDGKAFMALHLDALVFKLAETERSTALSLPGARLWDPSGKGRPMKEWIALSIGAKPQFDKLAKAALSYVQT